jgi:pilus assembly protein TadC
VSAELLAYSTRESSIIDQVCTESNVVVETATDTLRSVAEALGLDMTYLLILAIAIPVMVLIPLAFMCMTGIFMLVLLPIICMLVRCFKKKARRPIKVKSIEQETEATLE